MDIIKLFTDANRITTVWLDQPAKSVNTISPYTIADLMQAMEDIEREQPAGVIFASAKPHSFIAGADLFALRDSGAESIEKLLRTGQQLFSQIANLKMPTVAAINGDCLGGGLELALACKYRVAADDTSIKIGVPEVKLGLVPGWGGTVRLPRTIGLARALPIMLAGKTLSPRKAYRIGLVDDVVRPEALLDAARRLIRSGSSRRRPPFAQRALSSVRPVRDRIFASAKKQTEAKSFGNYPAPLRLIEVLREGYNNGVQSGLDAERRALTDLLKTDAAQNLIRIFFLRQAAKKAAFAHVDAKPANVEYATVVGGGTMGAGIVHGLINAGIWVRLVEVNPTTASAGLQRIRKMLDDDVRDGRLTQLASRHAMNRVTTTTNWTGLGLTQFAIEAVVERIDAKREVFEKLDRLTPAGAVLASNTSSLKIADISSAVKNPGRVVGMHFFNPVAKMPLVEIVRTPAADVQSLATAIGLAGRLGKTPVVVSDAPGFLVNRMLLPYLAEAAMMARVGVSIPAIDSAMKHWGWPMGPFELLDEIGLDVAGEVLKSDPDYVEIPDWIGKFTQRGWLGKKSGKGFYIYGKKQKSINPELDHIPPTPVHSTPEEIQSRLMQPMIGAAISSMEENIVDSTDTIDLATVMGLGFPPFRGGLAHYAQSIGRNFEPPAAQLRTKGDIHANV